MPDRQPAPGDAASFIARLNELDHTPSWTEAASLGTPLVNLSEQEFPQGPTGGERYFVASGEVIQRDAFNGQAHQSGWWYTQSAIQVRTPIGDRFQWPGIDPTSSIDSTAHVDPTALIEAGVTVGAHARIGAQAHIARDAVIGRQSVVCNGGWVGANAELGQHAWVSDGATVEPHCTIGHHAAIGAGSRVIQAVRSSPTPGSAPAPARAA